MSQVRHPAFAPQSPASSSRPPPYQSSLIEPLGELDADFNHLLDQLIYLSTQLLASSTLALSTTINARSCLSQSFDRITILIDHSIRSIQTQLSVKHVGLENPFPPFYRSLDYLPPLRPPSEPRKPLKAGLSPDNHQTPPIPEVPNEPPVRSSSPKLELPRSSGKTLSDDHHCPTPPSLASSSVHPISPPTKFISKVTVGNTTPQYEPDRITPDGVPSSSSVPLLSPYNPRRSSATELLHSINGTRPCTKPFYSMSGHPLLSSLSPASDLKPDWPEVMAQTPGSPSLAPVTRRDDSYSPGLLDTPNCSLVAADRTDQNHMISSQHQPQTSQGKTMFLIEPPTASSVLPFSTSRPLLSTNGFYQGHHWHRVRHYRSDVGLDGLGRILSSPTGQNL